MDDLLRCKVKETRIASVRGTTAVPEEGPLQAPALFELIHEAESIVLVSDVQEIEKLCQCLKYCL